VPPLLSELGNGASSTCSPNARTQELSGGTKLEPGVNQRTIIVLCTPDACVLLIDLLRRLSCITHVN
jgi:hypothetical protein